MSSFKDHTATTSNLTGVSDDSGDNHEDDSGQFDEDEDDYKDYKEPKEEELSLLGNSESNESIPVPIIRSASRHKHYSAGSRILPKSPKHAIDHSCSEMENIQIATESHDMSHTLRGYTCGSCSTSSVGTLCGPNPKKITLICIFVTFIWMMAVFIIHLDKKLSLTTESLSETQQKIKTIQDSSLSNNMESNRKLEQMEHKLNRIIQTLKSGKHRRKIISSKDKVKVDNNLSESQEENENSISLDKKQIKNNGTEEDFFSSDWDF